MAALAAVASPRGRDAGNPLPLMQMVSGFISYDELMPPIRLLWSRLLARPLMEPRMPRDHLGSVVGGIFIDEVQHLNAWVFGHRRRVAHWSRDACWSSDCRGETRLTYWRLELRDMHYGDDSFFDAWVSRYGGEWPYVGPGRVRPGLERLYAADRAFDDLIDEHADAVEQGILGGMNREHRS